jgi:hydroxypyruvate isomerase
MPKFAANLSMMFNEVPFLDRFALAAVAGFKGVEYLFPYQFPVEQIAAKLTECQLTNVMFNLPAGNWLAGERGLASIPGREHEFHAGLENAINYARLLGTTKLHAMAGIAPPGHDSAVVRSTYVTNLREAAAELKTHGLTLLIEAINTRDIPGFYLNRQEQAAGILQEVGAENLKLQMDCYHMQIMEGDIATTLRKYASSCGHVQIAGVPARNEPNTGEVNYLYLFDLLDEIGYQGWVGCEYRPAGNTIDGLEWFRRYRDTNISW